MQSEDLQGYLREATCTKASTRRRWELLVRLVHQTFGDGRGVCMGNNKPNTEREGGVLGYRTRRGDVEGF